MNESGRLYSLVTKHWLRIITATLVLAGIAEVLFGDDAPGFNLGFFVFAWSAVAGSLWFMFDMAEKAISDEVRERVSERIKGVDTRAAIEAIPEQFALLFDRIFGEHHRTLRCFVRSSVASVFAVALGLSLWLTFNDFAPAYSLWDPARVFVFDPPVGSSIDYGVEIPPEVLPILDEGDEIPKGFGPESKRAVDWLGVFRGAGALLLALMLVNFIPDYMSLWETRMVMSWMNKTQMRLRLLFFDLVFTAGLSMVSIFLGMWFGGFSMSFPQEELEVPAWEPPMDVVLLERRVVSTTRSSGRSVRQELFIPAFPTIDRFEFDEVTVEPYAGPVREPGNRPVDLNWISVEELQEPSPDRGWIVTLDRGAHVPVGIFFYSAFFTSVWLWLYVASVFLSRVLLRMNNGVGFLLRVTDVERQPFRSMGFVSVLIVSGLFLLGLPLVLL